MRPDEELSAALRGAGVDRASVLEVATELLHRTDRAAMERVVDPYLESGTLLAFSAVGDWSADPDDPGLEPGAVRLVMLVALARAGGDPKLVADGVGRLFEDKSSDVRMLAVGQSALLGDRALAALAKRIDEDRWVGVRALATVQSWRHGAPNDPAAAVERLRARGSWQPYEIDAAVAVFERADAHDAAARLRATQARKTP